MTTHATHPGAMPNIEETRWRIDPARSSVEFHVPHFWGLITVKGRFEHYAGILDLSAQPAVELTIDADSLDTKRKQRDRHLRSADFFDVNEHPHVRFESDDAKFYGERLRVRGRLHAAGRNIQLDVDATLRRVAEELEVDVIADADHRQLGMRWSPLGMIRTPSKLVVHGRLIHDDGAPRTAQRAA